MEKNRDKQLDKPEEDLPAVLGWCRRMQRLLEKIELFGRALLPVLVLGETGTGKELVARLLHQYSCCTGEFVALNCAALVPELIDAQLFGHEKGAFTGAISSSLGFFRRAHGGTLFLDELGELSHEGQAKILRVIETGYLQPVGSNKAIHVKFRLLGATHANLSRMIKDGRFRHDLYCRFEGAVLRIPPLRKREGDAVQLAEAIWRRNLETRGVSFADTMLGRGVPERIQAYSWPGNVRELKMALLRAWVMNGNAPVLSEDAFLRAHPSLISCEVLELLRTQGAQAIAALARCTQAPESAIEDVLELLEEQGTAVQLNETTWTSAEACQRPAPAKLQPRPPELTEEAILELIRANGRVQRRDLETLFGCPRRSANRILTEMVEAGLLKSVPEGRSVFYYLRRRRSLL